MSSKNRSTLKSDLATKVPSTPNGVTAVNVRSLITDFIDSAFNPTDDGSPLTTVTKASVGLANVDNTSDVNKPVSTAQAAAIAAAIGATDTLETINVTTTNNANYSQSRPTGVQDHSVKVNVASGSSDYVANINLDVSGSPSASTKTLLVFNLPADKHATVNVKSGSTIIDTITNPLGVAGTTGLLVRWDGTIWYTALRSDGLDATGVTAGTYGDATHVAQLAVGADGRVTSASNVAVTIPNTAVTAGTYGDATHIPTFTVGADGRITGASSVPAGQRVFRPGPGPSLPPGVLIRGANIIPDDESALQMFQNWNTSSFAYLKLRLDLMAANGFNTVRLYSGMGFIATGTLTRAYYHTCMGQFIDYANKLGIYVYITAADVYDSLPSTYDGSLMPAIKTEVVAYAAFLDQFPNVVAIDIFNEFFYNGGFPSTSGLSFSQRATIALDWSTAVRAVTNIPITWSLPTTQSNGSSALWNSTAISELALIAPAIDFVDMHVYYDVVSADLTNYLAALAAARPGGIPLLIGECGMTADNSDSTRATRLARTGTIVTEGRLAGGLVWDLINNSAPENTNMGIFHHDYTPYPLAVAAVKAWPISLPAVTVSSNPSDYVIASSVTMYASTTGSDGNSGLTSGSPKTAQGAANYFFNKTLLTNCTIQLLDGVYSTPLLLQPFGGTGTVIIQGNVSDNAAVTFEMSGTSTCITSGYQGTHTYQFQNFRMHSGQAYAGPLRISGGNAIIGEGLWFVGEQSTACHIFVSDRAKLTFVDNCRYIVTGGAGQHFYIQKGASAFFTRFNIDFVSATRAFSQFLLIENLSYAEMFTSSGTGIGIVSGTVTGQRWAVNNLSILKTYGGQDPDVYFPGDSNGAADASSKKLIT